ncbi:alpha/beta fold hydrolase [Chloroflexi bacterium TSY]|nr:alpha/beta fold hydrolase [Chloroflexi bacterium TSY]
MSLRRWYPKLQIIVALLAVGCASPRDAYPTLEPTSLATQIVFQQPTITANSSSDSDAEFAASSDTSARTDIQQVQFKTADDIELAATYYIPNEADGLMPAVLLVHMAYSNRKKWNPFAQLAQEAGYAVLTFDLRGHGKSGGPKHVFDEAMDLDVDAALTWLSMQPEIDLTRIGLIGASVGASLALRGAVNHPEIRSVALLSPGMQLWQISLKSQMAHYGVRSALIVASEEDEYPARSSQTLVDEAKGYTELVVYPGKAHGTDLFASQEDLSTLLLDWLDDTVKP